MSTIVRPYLQKLEYGTCRAKSIHVIWEAIIFKKLLKCIINTIYFFNFMNCTPLSGSTKWVLVSLLEINICGSEHHAL